MSFQKRFHEKCPSFPTKQASDLLDQLSNEEGWWKDLQSCYERGAEDAEWGRVMRLWAFRLLERRPERECLDVDAKDARSSIHPLMDSILKASGYGR